MKEVKIKYFGALTDVTGKKEESLELQVADLEQFKSRIGEIYPELVNQKYRFAVDGSLVPDNFSLDGEINEISLLPAFAGG